MAEVREKDAQATIVELAQTLGWLVYHTHDSRHSAAGFPDLVLVSEGRQRVVFAELKRVGEEPKPEQVRWLDALAASGSEVYLWTINDLQEIAYALSVLVDGAPGSGWVAGHGRRDSLSEHVPGTAKAA